MKFTLASEVGLLAIWAHKVKMKNTLILQAAIIA